MARRYLNTTDDPTASQALSGRIDDRFWYNQRAQGIHWVTDPMYDDTAILDKGLAFQSAIDAAALTGGEVRAPASIFAATTGITIPAGVRVVGAGRGDSPLATPDVGTVFRYTGTGTAVTIQGHTAGLVEVVVHDAAGTAAKGLFLDADGRMLESVVVRDVLLYGFTAGIAFHLRAINSGAIAYGWFENVRVRNAKTGLQIDATGGGAGFANSNRFPNLVMSGTGFDYGIRARSGNDNTFHGAVIEMPSSTYGHIYVEGTDTEIEFDGRLEANSQASGTPGVYIGVSAGRCDLTFRPNTGAMIRDYSGRAVVRSVNAKGTFPTPRTRNLCPNARLGMVTAGTPGSLPGWTISATGGNPTIAQSAAEVLPDHYVLAVTVPAGGTAILRPTLPAALELPPYLSLGAYVKLDTTAYPNASAVPTITTGSGVASGPTHPGDGTWHFLGTYNAPSDLTAPTAGIHLINTSGAAPATFYLTCPTATWGEAPPQLETTPFGTLTVVNATSTTTLTSGNVIVRCDASGGAFTVNLPAVTTCPGEIIIVKKTETGANAITVDPNGAQAVDGALTTTLAGGARNRVILFNNGTSWDIIG